MTKKRITFIVNPRSGTGKQKGIELLIGKHLNTDIYVYELLYTERCFHATELAAEAVGKSDLVVVAGGDGTVNEVASALVGTATPLGIIPAGSGNGIARNFGIPVQIPRAIELLNHYQLLQTDTGLINNKFFLATAGCGFDAHIAREFSLCKKRGFSTYVKLVLREFRSFMPFPVHIIVDGKEIKSPVFMVTVANGKQFGNNAFIAPQADTNDGLLDLVLLKPFPLGAAPGIILRLFSKSIHRSAYAESFKGKNILVKQKGKNAHFDGDFFEGGDELNFRIIPGSLKIMVPLN